tara:strand:- start:120 stop:1751 length:1632 start_codon:yes stop_codon:yes gene_type:complete
MNIIAIHQNHDANIALYWKGKHYALQIEKAGGSRYQGLYGHRKDLEDQYFAEIDKIIGEGNKFDIFIQPLVSHFIRNKHGRTAQRVLNELKNRYLKEDGLTKISCTHHMSHAYAAFYTSPYDEAIALTFDGGGDGEYFTINHCNRKTGIKQLSTEWFNLGGWYVAMSRLIEQLSETKMSLSLPGKAMGILARGKVNVERAKAIKSLSEKDPLFRPSAFAGGRNIVLKNWRAIGHRFEETKKIFPNGYQYFDDQEAYDHMADVQWAFEKSVEERLEKVMKEYPKLPLVLAGGCALNVLNNEKLKNKYHPRGVYVPACPSDEGLALGYVLNETRPQKPIQHHNICPTLRDEKDFDPEFKRKGKKVTNKTICKLLAEGKVIGYVQGPSEYGPRALGHRSILCDPYFADMKDRINKIKHREWWRPFAPACRKEDAHLYFESANFDNLEYMSFAPMVREDKRDEIPAVVHVDGSSRLQTVTKTSNPKFYKLLSDWEKYHGKHVLLNTSFNIKGKAILNTYLEAFEALTTTELDYLCIENVLYDQKDFI